MGRPAPRDYYPLNALEAAKAVQRWLIEGGNDVSPLGRFCRILDAMVKETPFQEELRDSRNLQSRISEAERFGRRRPVWRIIARTIVVPGAVIPRFSREKAEWLSELIKLCGQYEHYLRAVKDFKTSVEAVGLSIRLHPPEWSGKSDVAVMGTFEWKGRNAKKAVEKIINALIPALAKNLKKEAEKK